MAINIKDFLDTTILSSLAFLIFVLLILYFTLKKIKIIKSSADKIINKTKLFLIIAFILLIWFLVIIILGKINFFSKNYYWLFVPNIFISWLVLFELLRRAYNSETIKSITDKIPQSWIIGVQFYRVVGIGFIFLWARGILPAAFAFPSGIGDIFIGLTAPFIAYLYYKNKPYSRKLAVIWNYLGVLDLIIALSIGVLGFPRPVQFVPLSPSTEPLSLFPLAIIPLFAVPLAIMLHLFSLRVLRKEK